MTKLLSFTLALIPLALQAQEPSPPARAPFNASLICAQTDSQHLAKVQFEPPAHGGTLGPVVSCDQGGLTLGPFAGQERQTIDPASVHRLWVRRGSGLAGAIWGGIAGGLAGYAIASARTTLCPGGFGTDCHPSVTPGVLVGLAAGAGVGWFFGRGIPRWKPIYQAGP